MNAYLKALRLTRWPRSLAIYVGIAAFFFLNREFLRTAGAFALVWKSVLAFLLTWAISTANYVINEIVDAPYDAHHPIKRHRPLIKGKIKKTPFLFIGILLTLASLVPAFFLYCRPFFYSLLALLAAGFIYNIPPVRTKDIPFLDSISESANNPIRFLIGWFAFAPAEVFPPLSLLLCWWAVGNFLWVAKRLSEFRYLGENAGNYRASLKRYSENSLILGMTASTAVFFIFYFGFAWKFKLESFFILSPFVIFYIFLFFRKTLREEGVMEEPESLLKRPKWALYTLFLIVIFFLSSFFDKLGT
ncbi:MAG: UbiA family prenyltransferase [Candidatus Aminicenantes bacterium]|jgi:4-hydroxybenzoate polyprenyltransferase